jgi:hypothetical protein
MEFYGIIFILILGFLNLALLFFLGTFIVRMNERLNSILTDLVGAIGSSMATVPPDDSDVQQKTWDQKFEEEIDAATRRMRATSNLKDLPVGVSYEAQNTLNKKANDGLIIIDK